MFNIFTRFDQIKQDLVETKIKWAEAEGEKERLMNKVGSLQKRIKYELGSQRDSLSLKSQNSCTESPEKPSEQTLASSYSTNYLPSFSFFSLSRG